MLLESFISDQNLTEDRNEIWNDFVAVFIKDKDHIGRYPHRMLDQRFDYANARRPEHGDLLRSHLFPGRSQQTSGAGPLRQFGQKQVRLYQIAYSEETWGSVPKSLLPLDNRANERADWAEYWPIRRFLQSENLDENTLYGFLSPRFSQKMQCEPEDILEFLTTLPDHVEVASFSPFFDLQTVFLSVFEQGEYCHPGLMDLSQKVVSELMPGVDTRTLLNTGTSAIYCNFFAAKPSFWKKWLALCERVFAMAESPDHPCAPALNRGYWHRDSTMPAKVFIIERMASLLLATSDGIKYARFQRSTITNFFAWLPPALLVTLDTLKTQSMDGQPLLLNAYRNIQREILGSSSCVATRRMFLAENSTDDTGHISSRGYEHWADPDQPIAPKPESLGLRWVLKQIFS